MFFPKDAPAAERKADSSAVAKPGEALARLRQRSAQVFREVHFRIRKASSPVWARTTGIKNAEGARPWEGLVQRVSGLLGAAKPPTAAADSPGYGSGASNAPRRPLQGGRTELSEAVAVARSAAFGTLVLFSLGMNLLVLASPLYMLQVYDRVLVTGRVETLALLTVMAAAALLVYGLLDALRSAVLVGVGRWLVDRLGSVYLEACVRTRLRGEPGGAQPLRDLAQLQAFVASPGLVVFFDLPWVPISLVLVWLLHPALGALALASLFVLLALGALNEMLVRQLTLDANAAQVSAAQLADAMVRNAEAVRAMGMLAALTGRWRDISKTGLDAAQRGYGTAGLVLGVTKSARIFVQSAMLGLGAWLFLAGEVTGGAMIASSVLLGRALQPVEVAVSSWRGMGLARAAWSRLQAHARSFSLEQEQEQEQGRMHVSEPIGDVSERPDFVAFDHVTYTPRGGSAPVLQNVSFGLKEAGMALAVMGPSGSGKSTLCRLLVGTARPDPGVGTVRLDGREVRLWDAEDLGRYVGYLPQDVELFAGTVRENIARMSEKTGREADKAVQDAAVLAQAHYFIERLPDGYGTLVGDGGMRLSGGQRQRVGLARALYGRPRLVVLDEPNANLDEEGEKALAKAIAELKRQRCTVVIVGHRGSTSEEADKVLHLVKGRVESFRSPGRPTGGPRQA